MDARELPLNPSLEQYRKQAKDLLKGWQSSDSAAIHRLQSVHPRLKQQAGSSSHPDTLSLSDAQFAIAREHGFESWPKFVKHIEAVNRAKSPVSSFERAVDAIIAGDEATLASLLSSDPKLVHARSTRSHHATLLHYISANGVEDYRQKTPPNIVRITEMLLNAGADVNAPADMYGPEDTTLSLAATSAYPVMAGVQIPLLELLLARGAVIDGSKRDTVVACLHNGRGEAAEYLAGRGAFLNLEGAAGVGRLDLVRTFFDPQGRLIAPSTRSQMESGFAWACEYGHTATARFLLDRGVEVGALIHGMTGLHWAVVGAQEGVVRLLLSRGAPLETLNQYGGTVLGQAIWSVENGWSPPERPIDWPSILRLLVDAGANLDAHPRLRERVQAVLAA